MKKLKLNKIYFKILFWAIMLVVILLFLIAIMFFSENFNISILSIITAIIILVITKLGGKKWELVN